MWGQDIRNRNLRVDVRGTPSDNDMTIPPLDDDESGLAVD